MRPCVLPVALAVLVAVHLPVREAHAETEAILPHAGRLLGPDDRPVTGTKPLTFSIYASASGGSASWTSTQEVVFDAAGAYTVQLGEPVGGEDNPIPWALFDGGPVFLGVTVDTHELAPRLRVGTVPAAYVATHALTAENVDCVGCVVPEALTGEIPADKLAPIPTGRLSGTLSLDQLPDIPAARVTGTFGVEQIPSLPLEHVTGLVSDARIEGVAAGKITGTLSPEQLAPIPGSKLTGESVGTAQLAPGAVTADRLSAAGCAAGQVLKASGGAFVCAADKGESLTAGAGLRIDGNVVSIPVGGVGAGQLAVGSVQPSHLSPLACDVGQVVKREASGWSCADDQGLRAVTVSPPLGGNGTAGSPIVVTPGGIDASHLASGAVTADRLAPNLRPVAAVGTDENTTLELWYGGTNYAPPSSSNFSQFVAVAVDSATGTATILEDVFPADAVAMNASLQSLAARLPSVSAPVILIATRGSWTHSNFDPAGLRAVGLHKAAAALRAGVGDARLAAIIKGGGTRSVHEVVARGGAATVAGWLTPKGLVASTDGTSALLVPGSASLTAALSADVDGHLEMVRGRTLDFGGGDPRKEPNAGKIGYGTFTAETLDIVGAGETGPVRKVKVWAEGGLSVHGPVFTTTPGADDVARTELRRYAGDQTDLVIENINGAETEDRIVLHAAGGTFVRCPRGFHSFSRGKLCMDVSIRPHATMDLALVTCSEAGARVCTHADFAIACQFSAPAGRGVQNPLLSHGSQGASLSRFNPTARWTGGWFGDVVGADTFATWNAAECLPNMDGPPRHRDAVLPYRCCF